MTSENADFDQEQKSRPEELRCRIVAAAARLLREGGRNALTTRAITALAGIQKPTLYRLFGDKNGLLDAVAEHVLTTYAAEKRERAPSADPLADFCEGWDRHVSFGLANPALFAIIWGDPDAARTSPAAEAGQAALRLKMRALAAAGLLRIDEVRAVALAHATCTGVILSLLDTSKQDRDPHLAVFARETVVAAITQAAPTTKQVNPAGAAIALNASLDQATMLTPGERHLMRELLDRILQAAN